MFLRPTSRDYVEAYESGDKTPTAVVRAVLDTIDKTTREGSLNAFIEWHREAALEMAEAATRRYRQGKTLGPLDGVPVAIKDEFDIIDCRTRAGTLFRGRELATVDATAVARLREAGAVFVGKTHMTEIGMGGTGLNPHYPTPRNPHDPSRLTGGSSSGSAAAVAAGLCPVALGSDAGGSIRMPAAICGIYGLKPTYGRIPTTGGALLSWSLDHLGPLGASIDDLGAFYDATAGRDPADEATLGSPNASELGVTYRVPDLDSLKFAWCPDFADDAEDDVRQEFHLALDALRDHGATVEAVDLEWALETKKVGYVTFCAEAAATQREWLVHHRDKYNLDTRLLLAVGEKVSAVEYLNAQRVRTLIRREFGEICEEYDAFLNPTLASVAPRFDATKEGQAVVDTEVNANVARYTFAGTLTGFPCVSIPCGAGAQNLPVGLHLMASAWSDVDLLKTAAAVDQVMPPLSKPRLCWDLLK